MRGTFALDLDRDTERLLLNRYVPANVLVNKSLEIQRFIGPTAQHDPHAPAVARPA